MTTPTAPVLEQRALRRAQEGPGRARGENARALLAASWLAVARPPVLGPAAAALGLTLLTLPWQDVHAVQVMHGVGVLLACALGGATDDPAGEVVAASPYPRRVRTLARLGTAAAVALPVYGLALVLAELRTVFFPTGVMVLEAVGYALLAITLGAGLRAWKGLLWPAYPTVVGFLVLAFGTYAMPRGWTLVDPQPWGPPHDAALLRWPALILVTLGVLCLALRDPAEGRRNPR